MKNLRILILALACIVGIGASSGSDSIIGIWRAVKSDSSDPAYKNPTGELQMQFATNGVLTVKLREPTAGAATTQTIEGKFTLISSNQVAFTLNGTTRERYRYILIGDKLRMEHLDFPVTNMLERIDKFSL